MSGLTEKPTVVNLNMDKETTNYIAKHDYIKVGDKEFISIDRAKLLVEKLANGATTGEKQCNLPNVSVCISLPKANPIDNPAWCTCRGICTHYVCKRKPEWNCKHDSRNKDH